MEGFEGYSSKTMNEKDLHYKLHDYCRLIVGNDDAFMMKVKPTLFVDAVTLFMDYGKHERRLHLEVEDIISVAGGDFIISRGRGIIFKIPLEKLKALEVNKSSEVQAVPMKQKRKRQKVKTSDVKRCREEGMTVKEIAGKFGVTPATVYRHLRL